MPATADTPTGRRLAVDELADDVLLELAQLEQLLRELVARAAAGGDRRALARSAGLRIAELRRSAPAAAAAATIAAYAQAARAVALLLRAPALALPVGTAAVAGRTATLIDEALRTVDEHSRQAIRAAEPDDVDERQEDAVTARVAARTGRRIAITVYSQAVVTGNVRDAANAGTADTLVAAGRPRVLVSSHGSTHPFCRELEGEEINATAQMPPWHPGCTHSVMPVGVTETQFADALKRAA